MAKTNVGQWDVTAASNADINSVDIAEDCSPKGMNNAHREAMRQVALYLNDQRADNTTAGTGAAYTLNLSSTSAVTAYADIHNMVVDFHTVNTSATPTLAVNGIATPPTLKDYNAQALSTGTMQGRHLVSYNSTDFIIVTHNLSSLESSPDDLITTRGDLIYGNASAAAARLATGAANTMLSSDGTDVSWIASPIGQQTIWVPAGAMTARTSNGPVSGSTEMTTNKQMLESFDFDSGADEAVQFAVQMPEGWDAGTLICQAVWSHAVTTTNFSVLWAIQSVAYTDGDAADVSWGTSVYMLDEGGTTNDIYISPESGAMTVAGTPSAGEYVMFQIYRDVDGNGTPTNDDLAVDARLHGVRVHYTIDTANDN